MGPIWFHWNGRELVMGTPPKAPKPKALNKNPKVSLTIDYNEFPTTARRGSKLGRELCPSMRPRQIVIFEAEQALAWLAQLRTRISSMVRVMITRESVGLLDNARFPSVISS